MPENLFCKSFFIVQYTLGNKINAITLINTFATRYNFINEKFASFVCQTLEIEPECATKSNLIQGFNGRASWPVTHAIYSKLSVSNHSKSSALLLITKLGHYSMIFDHA